MFRVESDWIPAYQEKGALWIHDGNVRRPHALLTSGKHSSGFFNSRLVISDETLLREAASDLLELFSSQGGNVSQVYSVVGPQTGATKLAELMSDKVTSLAKHKCFWASPAKNESEGQKSMVFSDSDREFLSGRAVLLCDDVLTTCGSAELTAAAITKAGGIVLPFILAFVNRSGFVAVGGKKIIALINREMPIWSPDECSLCKSGSKAVRPKDNWHLLNATY